MTLIDIAIVGKAIILERKIKERSKEMMQRRLSATTFQGAIE